MRKARKISISVSSAEVITLYDLEIFCEQARYHNLDGDAVLTVGVDLGPGTTTLEFEDNYS